MFLLINLLIIIHKVSSHALIQHPLQSSEPKKNIRSVKPNTKNNVSTKDDNSRISLLEESIDGDEIHLNESSGQNSHGKDTLQCEPWVAEKITEWPDVWLENQETKKALELWSNEIRSDGKTNDQRRLEGIEKVRNMTQIAFKNYTLRARSSKGELMDDLDPESGKGRTSQGNIGITNLDSLDTLYLMGLMDEFNEGVKEVENRDFKTQQNVSVFETTIRGLGGLLGAYTLSCNNILREKAKELGEALWGAFEHHIPEKETILGGRPIKPRHSSSLAAIGSYELEFIYLSEVTQDSRYSDKARDGFDVLVNRLGGIDHMLAGETISASSSDSLLAGSSAANPSSSSKSFSAGSDSYYEYLLKVYLQGGKKDTNLVQAFQNSIDDGNKLGMFKKLDSDTAVVTRHANSNVVEELSCFMGGLMMLGEKTGSLATKYFKTGEDVTNGCYKMSRFTPTKLAPEVAVVDGKNFERDYQDSKYRLRPETLESIMYGWYFTGKPIYQEMALNSLDAIEKHCKTKYGFSIVTDVFQENSQHDRVMESFFIAEVLKYLYITLQKNPHGVIDLDKYVYSTEAHPFRIKEHKLNLDELLTKNPNLGS